MLLVVTGVFLILFVLTVGVLMLRLHHLPHHIAEKEQKIQLQVVAVLVLLAMFTHENLYWIAGLLLAMIDLPDFAGLLNRIASSVERIAWSPAKPPTGGRCGRTAYRSAHSSLYARLAAASPCPLAASFEPPQSYAILMIFIQVVAGFLSEVFHQRCCRQRQNDDGQHADMTHCRGHCWRHPCHHEAPRLANALPPARQVFLDAVIEISGRPDNAKLILRSSLARAAGVTASGRTRTQNSSRLVSYRSWLVRSAWPHSANSFCR